jgi:pimeloyl-ACP methyl ester carboxylesterase
LQIIETLPRLGVYLRTMTKSTRFSSRTISLVSLLVALVPMACAGRGSDTHPAFFDGPDHVLHPARMWDGSFVSEGAHMNAIVYEAAGEGPHPTAILLHGFPGNERNLDLAQVLRRGGWNAVFFHYRGAWGSGGEFGFGNALEDVRAVIEQVRAPEFAKAHRIDPGRIGLVGHSMGAFLAISAAAQEPEVDCVVAIAAADLGRYASDASEEASDHAAAERFDGMLEGRLAGTSGDDLVGELKADPDQFDLKQKAQAVADRPVLLVAGARDDVTPVADQQALGEAIASEGGDARVVVLDADHGFSSTRVALAKNVLEFLDMKCR